MRNRRSIFGDRPFERMIGDRECFGRNFSDLVAEKDDRNASCRFGRQLIESGVNVNCVDIWGQSVLHALAKRGTTESMFFLLTTKCEPESTLKKKNNSAHTNQHIRQL